MKRCPHCSAIWDDSRETCPDCGTELVMEEDTSEKKEGGTALKLKALLVIVFVLLLAAGAWIFAHSLSSLIDSGYTKTLKIRLSLSKDSIDDTVSCFGLSSYDEYSLLEYAILQNRTEAFALLLDMGADVNYVSEDGDTPLSIAVVRKRNAMIEDLIEHGADTNAMVNGYYSSPCSVLAYSVSVFDDDDIAEMLIDGGADVNGTVPVKSGNEDISIPLVSYAAVIKEDMDLVSYLVSHGADINCIDEKGYTVLERCMWKNMDAEALKRLISIGADINIEDAYGRTAVIRAIVSGKSEDVILVLAGTEDDINRMHTSGMNTMMAAVINRTDLSIIKQLVYLGADLTAETKYGSDILDLAEEYSDEETKEYLEDAVFLNEFTDTHILDEAGVLTAKERRKAGEVYYNFYEEWNINLVFITVPDDVLHIDLENFTNSTVNERGAGEYPRIIIAASEEAGTYITWNTSTGLDNEYSSVILNDVQSTYCYSSAYEGVLRFESMVREMKENEKTEAAE